MDTHYFSPSSINPKTCRFMLNEYERCCKTASDPIHQPEPVAQTLGVWTCRKCNKNFFSKEELDRHEGSYRTEPVAETKEGEALCGHSQGNGQPHDSCRKPKGHIGYHSNFHTEWNDLAAETKDVFEPDWSTSSITNEFRILLRSLVKQSIIIGKIDESIVEFQQPLQQFAIRESALSAEQARREKAENILKGWLVRCDQLETTSFHSLYKETEGFLK